MACQSLSPGDPSSFSRPEDVLVKSMNIGLDVDFKKHILDGKVLLDVEKINATSTSLILDTREVTVKSVVDDVAKSPLTFTVGEPVHTFGSKLEIQLPGGSETKFKIQIEYETSPNCTALQWLNPEQTAGKIHPYLFSQCQAIHARSMVPCQDTPGVKAPYTAQISAPANLVALMSAVKEESEPHPSDSSKMVHNFTQKVPIPSYLIAIVVGALESRDIGPRSKVWSEKEMVEVAAFEFAETEKMLATAEELLGPYVWGVYDLLVLPPSFPYGGMENPCLTFVTPTLLAGDRSLAFVVAHEISHSWTGNLVTNKSPEHFWLNEGHTVFVERKIAGRMHGENFRHFEAIGGWKDLTYQIEEVFGVDHEYTKLVPNLKGVDPDDAFSTVPYEKGSNLLMYLEQKLGGPAVFEPFLKAYINEFKYKSITTDEWKTFLYSFFKNKKSTLDEVDWNAWFFKPGMPPVKPKYDTTLADACAALANRWVAVKEDPELAQFTGAEISGMSPYQIREFVGQLLEEEPLTRKKIENMDKLYNFSAVKNSEIRFRWLRLCLRAKLVEAIPKALEFVNEQGRMKFVRPLYRDLYKWEESSQAAVDNYKKYSSQMHCLTAAMVGKDLEHTSL